MLLYEYENDQLHILNIELPLLFSALNMWPASSLILQENVLKSFLNML